jgi:hypothetical protein
MDHRLTARPRKTGGDRHGTSIELRALARTDRPIADCKPPSPVNANSFGVWLRVVNRRNRRTIR